LSEEVSARAADGTAEARWNEGRMLYWCYH